MTPIATLARRLTQPASRRASLLTIGLPGVAAVAGFAPSASGKKKRRRSKNKNKNKNNKKCQRQVEQCNGVFAPLCQDEGAPEECIAQTAACCAHLDDCQADVFIDCFLTLIRPPEPEVPR